MGLKETLFDEVAEHMLDLNQASLVTFDDFQLLYFEIFKNVQLCGGKEIDFEHFEMNNQMDNLLSDRNKGEVLNTESQLFDQDGEESTYGMTSGQRGPLHSQS